MNLPETLRIEPLTRPVRATVCVPGSKSYTNRALVVAGLAEGRSKLTGVLDSEDTQVMIEALRRLGVEVDHHPGKRTAIIEGCGGKIAEGPIELFCENSGTSIRFLTAFVSLGHGSYTLDGIERMRQRPIGDLIDALASLGVDARSVHGDGCPPVVVEANGLTGGDGCEVSIRGDVSSQFLSALLMVGPAAAGPIGIGVDGPLVSRPYIDMTLAVMEAFGARFECESHRQFTFPGGGGYIAAEYAIEPDASAASYFFGAAAVTGGTVTVTGLGTSSLQGDLGFARELERMGCRVEQSNDATTVTGGPLSGIDTDLRHLSDTVPTLAAVACFADSPTRIRGVAHVRVKETDRLAALATELRKAGTEVEEHPDGLTIVPAPLHAAEMDTYNDHRMAMSLALLGLRTPGIVIRDPACTVKTYPEFFADLQSLRD